MRLLIILIFLLKTTYASSTEKVVYLDVQFIIDNSKIGLFYKDKLIKIKDEKGKDYTVTEFLDKVEKWKIIT